MADSKKQDAFENFKSFIDPQHVLSYMKNNSWADLGGLMQTVKKNTEALSHAGQIVMQNMQEASKKQGQVMQKQGKKVADAMQSLNTGAGNHNQAAQIRDIVSESVDNAKEIAQMVSKTGFEVYDLLTTRMVESINESTCCPGKK